MNYLMERDTAAHDLAEVRKLIDSMNSLVNQQQQQQQKQQQEYQLKQQQELELKQKQQHQQQQQQQQQQRHEPTMPSISSTSSNEYPCKQNTKSATATASNSTGTTQASPSSPTTTVAAQQQQNQVQASVSNKLPPFTQDNAAAFLAAMAAAAAASQQQNTQTPSRNATINTKTNSPTQDQSNQQQQKQQPTLPVNGIVIEVNHLFFNKTLYFQLSLDATIEPLVTWLRLSFNDSSVSGMVLQYKGADGLWKCLLNRDDSLKRVLNQSFKSNTTLLQMRVPREQDLLSSGYTDRRLLALTKPSV
ncbi:unnamed protein product [Absidia cylindrospora]